MLPLEGIVLFLTVIFIAFYFPRVKICGNSMFPTYYDGQALRARRIIRFEKLEVGAVYVFYAPDDNKVLIKRLTYLIKADFSRTEYCYFLGDNNLNSRDSRDFGYVPRDRIIAKIL